MNSKNINWLNNYISDASAAMNIQHAETDLVKLYDLFISAKQKNNHVWFIGNGASAATASHCALDFTKHAGLKAHTLHDSALLTAYTNDYGQELAFAKALEKLCGDKDIIVLISASGKSPNILAAAEFAQRKNLTIITLTGFAGDNPLALLGNINFHVKSNAYNIIESTHQLWLLAVCDLMIGQAEYQPSKI